MRLIVLSARGSRTQLVWRERLHSTDTAEGAVEVRPLEQGRVIAPGTTVCEHLHRSGGVDVYDAWNAPRACRVVVKTPSPDRLGNPGARTRLVREGRLLRRLTHPHLVRAYEVHDACPRPAVVLERFGGPTLEDRVRTASRPLGAAELAALGSHLASALTHLHGEGLLHLDLRPSVVVLEPGGAKVADLSRARPPGPMRPGVGTWGFRAPEQAGGGEVGPPADVWGLGIVLHAAATGAPVLERLAGELGTDDPQLQVRVPALAAGRRRLPGELTGIVDACLEPSPVDRPALAEAFAVLDDLA